MSLNADAPMMNRNYYCWTDKHTRCNGQSRLSADSAPCTCECHKEEDDAKE